MSEAAKFSPGCPGWELGRGLEGRASLDPQACSCAPCSASLCLVPALPPRELPLWAPQTVTCPSVSCQSPALSPPSPGTFSCTELLEYVHSQGPAWHHFLRLYAGSQTPQLDPTPPQSLRPQYWGIPMTLTECWEYKPSSSPAPSPYGQLLWCPETPLVPVGLALVTARFARFPSLPVPLPRNGFSWDHFLKHLHKIFSTACLRGILLRQGDSGFLWGATLFHPR